MQLTFELRSLPYKSQQRKRFKMVNKLASKTILRPSRSRVVQQCRGALEELVRTNVVRLKWVPWHRGASSMCGPGALCQILNFAEKINKLIYHFTKMLQMLYKITIKHLAHLLFKNSVNPLSLFCLKSRREIR